MHGRVKGEKHPNFKTTTQKHTLSVCNKCGYDGEMALEKKLILPI